MPLYSYSCIEQQHELTMFTDIFIIMISPYDKAISTIKAHNDDQWISYIFGNMQFDRSFACNPD